MAHVPLGHMICQFQREVRCEDSLLDPCRRLSSWVLPKICLLFCKHGTGSPFFTLQCQILYSGTHGKEALNLEDISRLESFEHASAAQGEGLTPPRSALRVESLAAHAG